MNAVSFTPLSAYAIQRTLTTASGDIIAQAQSYRRPICDSIVSAIFYSVTFGSITSINQTRDIKHIHGVLHLAACLNATIENHLFNGIKLLYTTEYTHHAKPNYHGYCIVQNGPRIYLHKFEQGVLGRPFISRSGILLLHFENENIFTLFKSKLRVALANNDAYNINPRISHDITRITTNWINSCLKESDIILKVLNEYKYDGMIKIVAQEMKKQILEKVMKGEEELILGNIKLILTDICPLTLQSAKELLTSENPICAFRKHTTHSNDFYLVDWKLLKGWVNENPIDPRTRKPIREGDVKFLDHLAQLNSLDHLPCYKR